MARALAGVVIGIMFAGAGCADRARDDAHADAWVEVLIEARSLGSFTGFGMGRTDESIAWNALLERPDASERFVEIVERGNTLGAVYGLSGLWLVDREAYAERWADVALALHERGEPVRFHRGCIADEIPHGSVIARIVDGTIPGRLLVAERVGAP